MKIVKFLLIIFLILLVSCTKPEHIVEQATPNQVKNVDVLKNGDTSQITTEEVSYFENSNGFLAKPAKEGIYPAVVMIHEWWGLNDNIKEMARSLAAEGYVVLAVDLFEGKVGKDANEARELTTKVRNNMAKAVDNMEAAVQYLKNQDNVDDSKIASMGWCFGGGMSLQLALNEKMAATIIYYGQLETNATKLSSIKWPVLGIFGGKDTSIPVESVRKFETALNELKIENEIHIYPNVGHAFANPSGMNYAPNETKDAWEKTLRFLERELKNNIIVIDDTPILNYTISKISPYPFSETEEFQKTHGTNLTIQGNKIIFHRIFTRPTICDKFDYFVTKNDSTIKIKSKRNENSSDTCVAIAGYDYVEINITLDKGKYIVNLYQTDYYKNYPSNEIIFTKEIEIEQPDEKILTSIPDEWKICDVDSDCVETKSGPCPCTMGGGQTAINRNYLDLWIKNWEKQSDNIACLAVIKCGKFNPKCIDKICKLVPN